MSLRKHGDTRGFQQIILIEMAEKIGYLDGLRGIAAIAVVFSHTFSTLLPAMILGTGMASHLGGLENIFATTPLNLFYNGNFAVCIFFVLSGYVLTRKYFKTKDPEVIISGAARRYVRLFIPVCFVVMLSFTLYSLGSFHYYLDAVNISAGGNYNGHWDFKPDIFDAFKQAAWDIFFVGGDTYYDPVLWTMTTELFGSMLVFALCLLFGSLKNRWIAYLIASLYFFDSYYLAFIIGMSLADTFKDGMPNGKTNNKILLAVLLLVGLLFGSYPVIGAPANSIYSNILGMVSVKTPFMTYHIIGASAVLYVLLCSTWLQATLSSRIPDFLGKISYPVYLVHFLVISSLTSALFIMLYRHIGYGLAVVVAFAGSMLVIIPAGYFIYRYVDQPGIRLSKTLYERIFQEKATAGSMPVSGTLIPASILRIIDRPK